MFMAIWKGSHNPTERGLTITMAINHLQVVGWSSNKDLMISNQHQFPILSNFAFQQILAPCRHRKSHSKCQTFDGGDPCDWKSNQLDFFGPKLVGSVAGLWFRSPESWESPLMFSTSETKPMVFFSGGNLNVLGICMGKSPNLPEWLEEMDVPPKKEDRV